MTQGATAATRIRACLLDSGGILFANVTEDTPFFAEIGRLYSVDGNLVRAAYEDRDAEFECGACTATEVLIDALGLVGVPRRHVSVARLHDLYNECIVPYTEVFRVLEERPRRDGGLRVALANNEARDWEAIKHSRFGHLALFDAVASSWALGLIKPTAEYFQAALEVVRASAAETVFIDDNELCIIAASDAGIPTVHYEGVEALVAVLTGEST